MNLSDIFSDLNTESSVILPKSIKIKNIKHLDIISNTTSSFIPQKGGNFVNSNKDINQLLSMLSTTSESYYTANSTDTEQLKNKLFNILQEGGSPPSKSIMIYNFPPTHTPTSALASVIPVVPDVPDVPIAQSSSHRPVDKSSSFAFSPDVYSFSSNTMYPIYSVLSKHTPVEQRDSLKFNIKRWEYPEIIISHAYQEEDVIKYDFKDTSPENTKELLQFINDALFNIINETINKDWFIFSLYTIYKSLKLIPKIHFMKVIIGYLYYKLDTKGLTLDTLENIQNIFKKMIYQFYNSRNDLPQIYTKIFNATYYSENKILYEGLK